MFSGHASVHYIMIMGEQHRKIDCKIIMLYDHYSTPIHHWLTTCTWTLIICVCERIPISSLNSTLCLWPNSSGDCRMFKDKDLFIGLQEFVVGSSKGSRAATEQH